MGTTQSFDALAATWTTLMDHWRFSAFMSFISSFFAYLIGIENRELMLILLIMILVETVIGSMLAIKERRFNARGMSRGIMKVILYGCFLIMFHISELIIDGTSGFQLHLIDTIAYFYLIIREAKSSNEKLAKFSIALPINPFLKIERILNRYAEEFEKMGEDPNRRA